MAASVRLLGGRWATQAGPSFFGPSFVGQRCSSRAFFRPSFQLATPWSPRLVQPVKVASKPRAGQLYAKLAARAFSTSARASIRPYYAQGGRGGGRGRGDGPWSRLKDRIDGLNSNVIIFGIMAVNGAVYAAWAYAQESLTRFRDPQLMIYMFNNWAASEASLRAGRIWTLFTAAFSHREPMHLFMTMLGFFFTAPTVVAMTGNVGFIGLYLFAAGMSSVTSLVASYFIPRPPGRGQTHILPGASGSVLAILTYLAARAPTTTFYVMFVIPVPAWLCIGGILAWDGYQILSPGRSGVGSPGHVGGVAAGWLYFLRAMGRI